MKPSALPPTVLALAAVTLLVCACAAPDDRAPSWTPAPSDWPAYGGDDAGTRYSALEQVTPENVATLRVAWTWSTGDVPVPGPMRPIPGQDVRAGNFEVTPIVIGDTMYLSTPFNRVVALNAASSMSVYCSYTSPPLL